jgi:hypothetical protein
MKHLSATAQRHVDIVLRSLGLPPPPADMKYSVSSFDELLKGKNLPISKRMELKETLRQAGLLR